MAEPRRKATAEAKLEGTRVLVVEARFYDDIADALLDGASRKLTEAGVAFDVITVPGALEIAAAITMAMAAGEEQGKPYHGVVALGCVIRGETSHYDIVAGESARALTDLAINRRLPIGNGILTVDTEAQAWARAKPSEMDKGGGAAAAAHAMIRLKRRLAKG